MLVILCWTPEQLVTDLGSVALAVLHFCTVTSAARAVFLVCCLWRDGSCTFLVRLYHGGPAWETTNFSFGHVLYLTLAETGWGGARNSNKTLGETKRLFRHCGVVEIFALVGVHNRLSPTWFWCRPFTSHTWEWGWFHFMSNYRRLDSTVAVKSSAT